jgi:hypothetical protein
MDFKKLKENRELYNKLILNKLQGILDKNPDLRFNQLMHIINGQDDYFNEEPWVTYKRINEKFPD